MYDRPNRLHKLTQLAPRRVIPLIAITALLGACSSTPMTPSTSATTAMHGASTAATDLANRGSATGSTVASAAKAPSSMALGKMPGPEVMPMRERSVFFEFDQYALDAGDSRVLDRHARHLLATPDARIRIEGHADERGGAEYNLALGQRRAEVVQRALQVMGVKPAQMETQSWGEEKPQAMGHDENDWQRNRRAELVYRPK